MNKTVAERGVLPRRTFAALAIAALLAVGGCASNASRPGPTDEAAAYNLQLGIAYLQQGNLAFAKEKLERALQQSPRDARVHGTLALLHERLGEPDRARSYFRSALRLAPNDPDLTNNYAVFLCQNGRVEEGVERFYAVARNPLYRTPEVAYTNAGVCLRSAKRYDEAARSLGQALQIRPNSAEAVLQLGDLELERGQPAEARAQLERYLSAFAATPDLLLLGVRISNALGDKPGAERYARRLRTDFPGSEQTRALSGLQENPG